MLSRLQHENSLAECSKDDIEVVYSSDVNTKPAVTLAAAYASMPPLPQLAKASGMEEKINSSHDVCVDLSEVVELQQSPQKLPQISKINESDIEMVENEWKRETSINEDEILTFADFEIFDNLQNPSHDSLTECIAKFRLITKSPYRINKCTYGTFCCRNKAREYINSFHILELLIDVLIFPFLLILFFILMFVWSIVMIVLWFSIKFSCCCCINYQTIRYSQLKKIDNCIFTSQTSLIDDFDFKLHRVPSYFPVIIFQIPFNYVHYITGGFKYKPLISDDLMYFAIAMCPTSREIVLDYPNSISLDLHPNSVLPRPYATEITLFPGHALVVKNCGWDIQTQETYITVVDVNGKDLKIYNKKDNVESIRLWKLAKAHLQCTITWYAPSWTHNWIHFHLLDISAKCRHEVVSSESVIGHLLHAHLRYTSSINESGIGDALNQPHGKYGSIIDKYTPYKIDPMSGEQFVFKVAQNCSNYYLNIDNCGVVTGIDKDKYPPKWVKDRMNIDNDNDNNNNNCNVRGLIPYLDMCADYYIVIKRFIDNLWLNDISNNNHYESLLEKDMVYQFIRHVEANGMPGLSQIEPQSVLATLIWTSGVVHSADHVIYGKIFDIYGFHTSPQPWDGKYDTWKDILQGSFGKHQWRAFKSKCFNDTFVNYHKSWFWAHDTLADKKLYKNFKYVPDDQRRIRANKIHKLYLEDLKYVNEQWKWLIDINDLAASTCF